jgi:tRNA threonylcarbamoyl adenosine modification protein YeaZ
VLALGIDTSTPMVSVAVVGNGTPGARRDRLVNNGHGEALAGLVAEVLAEVGVVGPDIAVVGVGLGPGPFTGLRVGVVTAAAFSAALGIPAFGMCSLDAVFAADGQPYAVVTDARRRQVYWAAYDGAGQRTDGPEISAPDELAEHLRGRVGRLTGPAPVDHSDVFAEFVVTGQRWPDAAVIAGNALERKMQQEAPAPLKPMYLRRPDAREPGPPKRVTPT